MTRPQRERERDLFSMGVNYLIQNRGHSGYLRLLRVPSSSVPRSVAGPTGWGDPVVDAGCRVETPIPQQPIFCYKEWPGHEKFLRVLVDTSHPGSKLICSPRPLEPEPSGMGLGGHRGS